MAFSQNTGFAQLTIRGIGTNAVFAGSDPSSAVYFDGVYLARPAMVLVDFLDVERVEALRGPQGTLYGRNAVGGALNVITKAPTDELEASARASVGDYESVRAEARLAGAIVPGRVAASAAVLRGVQQGYVRDLEHPDDPLGGEDVTAARGKLRVGLGARGDLLVSADVTHQDPRPLTYAKVLAVKPGFEIDNPRGPREVRTSTLGESRNLQHGVAARLALRLSSRTTLTSLTAYRKLDYDVFVDTDITELELVVTDLHEIQHQWSEELTLSGRQSGVTWVGGLFLLTDSDHQPTSLLLGDLGVENRFDPRVEASTGALFGQATISLTRSVPATAGLRFTRERKTFDAAFAQYPLGQPEDPVAGVGYAFTDAISHSAWTREARPGSAARQADARLRVRDAGLQERGLHRHLARGGPGPRSPWAWSYEAGLKHTFANGGRLNFAAFHTDYTDLQVQTTLRPGVIDISNAAQATIRGVELEGAWQPARALQLGGHLAWLDARYDVYQAVGVGVAGDVSGNRLSNAPEWSGRLWLEWKARAGRAGTLSLRSLALAEHRLLHAVQRRPAAPECSWPAGPERGGRARAMERRPLRAEPDRRGLHHRQLRIASPGGRGPPGAAAAVGNPAGAAPMTGAQR